MQLAVDQGVVIARRQHIVAVLGKAAGTDAALQVIVIGYREQITRLIGAAHLKDDFRAGDVNTLRSADGADMIRIPVMTLGQLEIRLIRRFAGRAGIGGIAADHAGTAVALCRLIGIAVRAGMVSVVDDLCERIRLQRAAGEDHLLAVGGLQQATERSLTGGQRLVADHAVDRSGSHVVLAGAIHLMAAHLAVGARLSVRIQLRAVILDRLHREGFLRGLHRQVHTGIIVVRDRFYIILRFVYRKAA